MPEEFVLDLSKIGVIPQLGKEQLEARDSIGNTLVIACPGAGKTEVATQRGEISSKADKKILALMFSRSARKVFQSRVQEAEVSTIHSYCLGVVGWKQNYADLLYRFILKEPKEEFDEVIVDELQDISPLQLDAILSIPKKSLFAVGDPNQSIYIGSWAGSYLDSPAMGARVFDKLASSCNVMYIHGNRRSNQHVVDLLNGIKPTEMVSLGPKELDTTVVLSRTREEVRSLSTLLMKMEVPHKIRVNTDREADFVDSYGESPKLDLMVMHTSKGREFKRVFILDWLGYTEEDFNLLYTSAARASEEVHIIGKKGMCNYLPTSIQYTFEEMLEVL